jgi:hypothetical protein
LPAWLVKAFASFLGQGRCGKHSSRGMIEKWVIRVFQKGGIRAFELAISWALTDHERINCLLLLLAPVSLPMFSSISTIFYNDFGILLSCSGRVIIIVNGRTPICHTDSRDPSASKG